MEVTTRGRYGTPALALLWGVAAFAAAAAHADDTHYQDILVGGRAIGLGGAFTSIADDPSGPYYNPAGLADARSTNLQVSTSLYGFERGSIPEGVISPVPGVDKLELSFTDLIIIPASAGFVKTFGPVDEQGHSYQAYGLSVVVPSYRSFTAGASDAAAIPQDTGDLRVSSSYQRRVTDRELWSGIGYGRRVAARLRLGASGYYILRSVTDREHVTVSERLTDGRGDKFQSVDNDITLLSGALVFIAGARYLLTDRIAVGASITSPSVPLHSQVDLSFSRAAADPTVTDGPQAALENFAIRGKTGLRFAPAVRVGVSYTRTYKFTLSLDASYHAPISYTLIEPRRRDRVDYEAYEARLPFDPHIERRGVLNLNAGAEFLIVREVSIAGGLFTDFSSAPSIPARPEGDQAARVDLFGLAMAIGYFGSHTLSRLGVMYSFGMGSDVIPEGSETSRVLEGRQDFQRVDYFQSFFYVFLSSTFRY